MKGKLAGEKKLDGGLNLANGESALAVGLDKRVGLLNKTIKDIIRHGNKNIHGLARHAGSLVNLLKNLVNVRTIGRLALAVASPSALGARLGRCGARSRGTDI